MPPSSSVSGPASTAGRLSRFGGGWRTLPSTAMPLGIPVLNGKSLICAAPPPTPRTPSETLAPPWRMRDSSAPIPAAAAEASPLASPCAARRRSSAIGGLSLPVSFTAVFSNCARRPRLHRNDRRAARELLEHLLKAVPYHMCTILTDNGIQFAEQPHNHSTGLSSRTISGPTVRACPGGDRGRADKPDDQGGHCQALLRGES